MEARQKQQKNPMLAAPSIISLTSIIFLTKICCCCQEAMAKKKGGDNNPPTPLSASKRKNQLRTSKKSKLSDSQQLQFLLDIEENGGIQAVDLSTLARKKPDIYGANPRAQLRRSYESRLATLRSFSAPDYYDYYKQLTQELSNQQTPLSAQTEQKTPSPAKKTPAKTTPQTTEKTPATPKQTSKPKPTTPAKLSFAVNKSVVLPKNAFTMASRNKKNTQNESDDEEATGTYDLLFYFDLFNDVLSL